MTRAPHVVMDDLGFHCLHCGRHYAMKMPAPINVFAAATTAFVELHERCIDTRVVADFDPDFREVGQ